MNEFNKCNLKELISLLAYNAAVDVITPADTRYADARIIYNRMHNCYPGLIVRTLDIAALRMVMSYAFRNNIVLAIRGGGHHIGGFGTCNNGIVIDFSTFTDVVIDHDKKIASVSPGATLADIDRELCNRGYVIPSGTVSETGVAGLTLGGGIGWLIGQYGLTCDQLVGADVLLADGQLIKAEDTEHKDMLWALRGGGGNFGIVTTFRYSLNKLPKTVCGMGLVAWENAANVLGELSSYMQQQCPASMTLAPVFTKDKHNQANLRVDFCCAGGIEEDVTRLIELSPLITWSNVREWEFSVWQKEFDYILLPPKRGYWKASYIEILTPELIKVICNEFEMSPMGDCTIMIEHLHGAFRNFDQTTSAFPLRHTQFGVLISARWLDAAGDEENISWVRSSFHAIDPKGLSGSYLNYTSADDERAIQTLISGTKSRIAEVKSHYDPNNNFKRNHNVLPYKAALKEIG